MSYDVAAERGSQPAQRDELAHSRIVRCAYPWRGFTSHERYLTYRDYGEYRIATAQNTLSSICTAVQVQLDLEIAQLDKSFSAKLEDKKRVP